MSRYPDSFYSAKLPSLQLLLDSTSLGCLMECPRKYYYRHIVGWERHETTHDVAPALTFGRALHSGVETFLKDLLGFGGDFDTSFGLAMVAALRLLPQPWNHSDPKRTPFALLRCLLAICERVAGQDGCNNLMLNGEPILETPFNFELPFNFEADAPFRLAGRLDRAVTLGGPQFQWIADYKTTGYAVSSWFLQRYSPDVQFTLYCYAASKHLGLHPQGMLVEIIKVGGPFEPIEITRTLVSRHPSQLAEFEQNLSSRLHELVLYAQRGGVEASYPQNPTACSNYGGCAFREVCASPPQSRASLLRSAFRKTIYDPLSQTESHEGAP